MEICFKRWDRIFQVFPVIQVFNTVAQSFSDTRKTLYLKEPPTKLLKTYLKVNGNTSWLNRWMTSWLTEELRHSRHSSTRVLETLEDHLCTRHSKGTWTLGHSGTQGTWVIGRLSHSSTRRALGNLGTRTLGHLGTRDTLFSRLFKMLVLFSSHFVADTNIIFRYYNEILLTACNYITPSGHKTASNLEHLLNVSNLYIV